jgi:hypothetical protein
MRTRILTLFFLVTGACGGGPEADTTSTTAAPTSATESVASTTTLPSAGTLWGFTPFPTRPDLNGVIDAYRIADDHGDLIAHHLDECVPWDALENRTELPYDLNDTLQLRTEQSPRDAVVYVAMSLSAIGRDAVAPDCGGVARERSFADPEVIAGAKDWADLLVARLQPVFLNVGVEFNLLDRNRPDLGEGFEALILELIDHIHTRHPGVVVLASVQFDTMADTAEVAAVAGAVDLLGVSIYPSAFGATSPPSDDALDALAALGPRLAIAETGWPGAPAIVDGTIVPFTEAIQVDYVEWLGRMAERHDLRLVVWFFPGDPRPVFIDAPPDLQAVAALFATMGLVADDRTPRPALEVWDRLRAGL